MASSELHAETARKNGRLGGRPKGALSVNRRRLHVLLEREFGQDFQPVVRMAEHCIALDKEIKLMAGADVVNIDTLTERRVDAISSWDKVARYLTPQLKAVEHSGEVTTSVVLFQSDADL